MCLPTRSTTISHRSMWAPSWSHLITFPWLRVNYLMQRLSAPGARPVNCKPVLVQSCSIPFSRCISTLAQLQSPNWLDYSLQVPQQSSLITVSQLARSQAPSVSPNLLNYSLQASTIMACKCIYTHTQSQFRSATLISFDHCLHMYFQIRSITTSKCTTKLVR